MNAIYFEIMDFEKLVDFLDEFDWDNNDCDILIRKEKTAWTVCLKEKDDLP